MHYYQHHIGDFNAATRHLSRIERSIYRDLLELYYDSEKPLPLDLKHLCRMVIATTEEERDAVVQVLAEFFTESASGWHNKRCDEEIASYKAMQQGGRNGANKRWGKGPYAPPMDGALPLDGGGNSPANPAPSSGDGVAIGGASPPLSKGNANHEPVTNTTTSTTPARGEKPIRVGNFEPKKPPGDIPPPEILRNIPGFVPSTFAEQLRQSGVKLPDDEALDIEWARFRLSVADGPPDEPRMWIKRFLKSLIYLQRGGQLSKANGGNNATRKHKTTADVLEQLHREAAALESRACVGG